tara:strand:- start:292 stop:468 length:177 start_codon:yes stop_codon:yes gene_type:complete
MKVTNQMVEMWFSPEETLETFAREYAAVLNGEANVQKIKIEMQANYFKNRQLQSEQVA